MASSTNHIGDLAGQGQKSIELPIVGMHCASCAGSIEAELSRLGGVDDASVNIATERAARSTLQRQASVRWSRPSAVSDMTLEHEIMSSESLLANSPRSRMFRVGAASPPVT